MNKTVYVPSYFQPIYKEVTIKVPTGNTKRFLGLIDIEEKIRKREVIRKRKLTAVCSHQTRIGNLDAHLI